MLSCFIKLNHRALVPVIIVVPLEHMCFAHVVFRLMLFAIIAKAFPVAGSDCLLNSGVNSLYK